MFKFASGHEAGMDMIPIFEDLLDLFEDGAANGKRVLEVTGDDVAAFCDGLLQGARTYTEDWKQSLNKDIKKKLDPKEKGGDK
jgi:DNA-binding ferritin-like protein (Dps family)